MSDPTQVWCCGGGTQSAAIGAAICSGKLAKPDLAVIVDTGRERSATWEYFDGCIYPRLKSAGVSVERVRSDSFTQVRLFDIENSPLLPGFTTLSAKGKLSNFCSGTWKRDVIERWLRSIGVKTCRLWFGISLDEMRRVRNPHRNWIQHYYPIVWDLRLRRRECLALLESLGWPRPPRSACWMCPNAGDEEWLDREMRAIDPHFYLHGSCVPLDDVVFAEASAGEDRGCNTAFCFT